MATFIGRSDPVRLIVHCDAAQVSTSTDFNGDYATTRLTIEGRFLSTQEGLSIEDIQKRNEPAPNHDVTYLINALTNREGQIAKLREMLDTERKRLAAEREKYSESKSKWRKKFRRECW